MTRSAPGLQRTRSSVSSYHDPDPEFDPIVPVSPITSQTSRRDLETGASDADTRVQDEHTEKDYIEVQWDGPDDPACPLNTPPWRKW